VVLLWKNVLVDYLMKKKLLWDFLDKGSYFLDKGG